nr:MAG TPA: hypothetical protein [Inoviridae sp.]
MPYWFKVNPLYGEILIPRCLTKRSSENRFQTTFYFKRST